jgi:hypothetical protein
LADSAQTAAQCGETDLANSLYQQALDVIELAKELEGKLLH